MRREWRGRFGLGWLLVCLGLCNALLWGVLRWRYEKRSGAVAIAIDFDDVRSLADSARVPRARALRVLRAAGATHVALTEQNLVLLRASGRLTMLPREAAVRLFPFVARAFDLGRDGAGRRREGLLLWSADRGLMGVVEAHAREQSPPGFAPRVVALRGADGSGRPAVRGLVIAASPQLLNDASMGFDPAQVAAVRSAKLQPIALIVNRLNANASRIRARLGEARAAGARLVLFDDTEALGYSSLLPLVADELRKRGMGFGAWEFSDQRGLDDLSEATGGALARAHVVSPKEASVMAPEVLADRYARAARERKVRLLYVRLLHHLARFKTSASPASTWGASAPTEPKPDDPLAQNAALLRAVRAGLGESPPWARLGALSPLSLSLRPGEPALFGDFPLATLRSRVGTAAPVVVWAGLFVGGLGALGAWLLVANLMLDLSSRARLALPLCGAVAVAGLATRGAGGAKMLAFAAACAFPVVALAWSGLLQRLDLHLSPHASHDRSDLSDPSDAQVPAQVLEAGNPPRLGRRLPLRARPQRAALAEGESPAAQVLAAHETDRGSSGAGLAREAVASAARLLGLALAGGLIVASLLNDWRFASKTADFWGTKPAQVIPLALGALVVAGRFLPGEVASSGAGVAQRRAWRGWSAFLGRSFTLSSAAAAGAMVLALYLWIARSGNDAGVTVSPLEWKLRAALEHALIARPRNKELFAAYPALALALWCARRRPPRTSSTSSTAGVASLAGVAWTLGVVAIVAPIDVLNSFAQANNPLALAAWRSVGGAALGTLLGLSLAAAMSWALAPAEQAARTSRAARQVLGSRRVRFVLLLSSLLLIVGNVWSRWRAARRYAWLSAPSREASWPWSGARREDLGRGVSHWLARASDGTSLELLQFDFGRDPSLRLGLYDQDEDDSKPFDNRAAYWSRGLAPVARHLDQRSKGGLAAAFNGSFFGLLNERPRQKDRAFHLSPLVVNGRVHFPQVNHRWTLGMQRPARGSAPALRLIHLPTKHQLSGFEWAVGSAQCVLLGGQPLAVRPFPEEGEAPQRPPVASAPGEAGHIPVLDFMKTSRVSLGWSRDGKKMWLLFVKEPDGEDASRAQMLRSRPAYGGWRLDDVRRFWLSMRAREGRPGGKSGGAWNAVVLDGGDVAQLAFRRPNRKIELVPPRFSTPSGPATARYQMAPDGHGAPPSAQVGGALTYLYFWRQPASAKS